MKNRFRWLALFAMPLALEAAAMQAHISQYGTAYCTYSTGMLSADAIGGTPPYTYLWSTGAITQSIIHIPAGTYSVTITDVNSQQATASYSLPASPFMPTAFFTPGCFYPDLMLDVPFRFFVAAAVNDMGVQPVTLQGGWSSTLMSGPSQYDSVLYIWDVPPPGTAFTIAYTDANGCPGTISATVPQPGAFPELQALTTEGSCSGNYNGFLQVHVTTEPNNTGTYGWRTRLYLDRDGQQLTYITSNVNQSGTDFGDLSEDVARHNLLPGQYRIRKKNIWPSQYQWLYNQFYISDDACQDTTWFTIPDLGNTCGMVSGTAYMDDNEDCMLGAGEARPPQVVMEIQPGSSYTMTDATGKYYSHQPYGAYTIAEQSSVVNEHCVGTPIPFALTSAIQTATVNFADTAVQARDVLLDLGSGAAHPGFQTSYGITVRNLTVGSTGAMTVTLTFDPLLTFVSATPAGTVVGNVITWNAASLYSYGLTSFKAAFTVPADPGLIGTVLNASASVSIAQADSDPANNSDTNVNTITGSYDPNEKVSEPRDLYLIDQDSTIAYTLRFQNTGTDTAFFVVVTDTLPPELDPATFTAGASSHPYQVYMNGPGVLRFVFAEIDLPDSGHNEPRSHGFVSFRIKPRLPILPGTTISNTANIFFDYNPPVITEPNVLVAEMSTDIHGARPESNVLWPNPASTTIQVPCGPATLPEIYDMSGRRIELPFERHAGVSTVDVQSLPQGIYAVRTRAGIARFVKQ